MERKVLECLPLEARGRPLNRVDTMPIALDSLRNRSSDLRTGNFEGLSDDVLNSDRVANRPLGFIPIEYSNYFLIATRDV